MNTFLRFLTVVVLGGMFFALSPHTNSFAQPDTAKPYEAGLRFERLSVEDGLPNATVLAVLQDQDGFMWFATANGLARYDGSDFTVFRHSEVLNSLSNNNTFGLLQTADGLI